MSAPLTPLERELEPLEYVCRGCLAESGEMKNIYEWGLSADYFQFTNLGNKRIEGMSELLCGSCENMLSSIKSFQAQCLKSELYLKHRLKMKKDQTTETPLKNELTSILHPQKLVLMITAPKQDEKIALPCPYHCADTFTKKNDLFHHLRKMHNINESFQIDLKYYCSEITCNYHISSARNKSFAGRKFLNQHYNKMHKLKLYTCSVCAQKFPTDTDLKRHAQTCGMLFLCQLCDSKYTTNETLMVHLMRKHPEIHKKYKESKKRTSSIDNAAKRSKNEDESATEQLIKKELNTIDKETVTSKDEMSSSTIENNRWIPKIKNELTKELQFCDSPKKSFATQTGDDDNIKNDITLPSWTKTDEISTQTVFEDILSMKSQNSEDEIFFSESVSLSDIQTQTFPLEFGLSRSNKETQSINSQTESPDFDIKVTQTCFCHFDSPRPNFRLFDSLSSSPASIHLTTTETQTGSGTEQKSSVKSDVLLSFNSAETQTCFDDEVM